MTPSTSIRRGPCVNVLSLVRQPSAPSAPRPHAHASPSAVTSTVCDAPHATRMNCGARSLSAILGARFCRRTDKTFSFPSDVRTGVPSAVRSATATRWLLLAVLPSRTTSRITRASRPSYSMRDGEDTMTSVPGSSDPEACSVAAAPPPPATASCRTRTARGRATLLGHPDPPACPSSSSPNA